MKSKIKGEGCSKVEHQFFKATIIYLTNLMKVDVRGDKIALGVLLVGVGAFNSWIIHQDIFLCFRAWAGYASIFCRSRRARL